MRTFELKALLVSTSKTPSVSGEAESSGENGSLNFCSLTSTKLNSTGDLLNILLHNMEDSFRDEASDSFTNPNRSYSRIFVKCDEVTCCEWCQTLRINQKRLKC